MSVWVVCFVSIRFDLEIGPNVEHVAPEDALTEEAKTRVVNSAFPDCSTESGNDSLYFFTMNDCTTAAAQCSSKTVSYPATGSTVAKIYGAAYYRQKRDPQVPRGYVQQVVVLLSRIPYLAVHELILRVVMPRFCQCCPLSPDTEKVMVASALSPIPATFFEPDPSFNPNHYTQNEVLDEAIAEICGWPSPHPQVCYRVMLLHQSLGFVTPSRLLWPISFQQCAVSRPPMLLDNRVTFLDRKCMNQRCTTWDILPLYGLLGSHLHDLTRLWELLICSEPLFILSNSPSTASSTAIAVASLVLPIEFDGILHPYFTVQNDDLGRFSRCGKALPFPETKSIVVATTNPFFIRSFEGWPHLLVVTSSTSGKMTGEMGDHDQCKAADECRTPAAFSAHVTPPRRNGAHVCTLANLTTPSVTRNTFIDVAELSCTKRSAGDSDKEELDVADLRVSDDTVARMRSSSSALSAVPRDELSLRCSENGREGAVQHHHLPVCGLLSSDGTPASSNAFTMCSYALPQTADAPSSQLVAHTVPLPSHNNLQFRDMASASAPWAPYKKRSSLIPIGNDYKEGRTVTEPLAENSTVLISDWTSHAKVHPRSASYSYYDETSYLQGAMVFDASPVRNHVYTKAHHTTLVAAGQCSEQRNFSRIRKNASRDHLQHGLRSYFESTYSFLLNHEEQTAVLMQRLETLSSLSESAQLASASLLARQWYGDVDGLTRGSDSGSTTATTSAVPQPSSGATLFSQYTMADDIVRKFFSSLTKEFVSPVALWFSDVSQRVSCFHMCDTATIDIILDPEDFLQYFHSHYREVVPPMWVGHYPYKTYRVIYEKFARGALFKAYVRQLVVQRLCREVGEFVVEEWAATFPTEAERLDMFISLYGVVQREHTQPLDPDVLFITAATSVLASMALYISHPLRDQLLLKIAALKL